ncbi:MAG: hypothetical protein A3A33_03475 [Candidatus Yanofskybacteria bacterium RIFCSPLOWO2_01_FULL_49_25]|uniref:Uncharacterized protein n=1 Tax=Candidatus Yanofskybacteria bacterium RIFCSPLOWO2_01_FULL_49_25 TaxID=1802701 RepID=A0A1F8GTU8_9BACT|nr:MAG: hypothetical protein A3A33_03475 [Candidatus Yanofskybacteria bacterium RIFCSPLOWO2_01_FULL_49_25]
MKIKAIYDLRLLAIMQGGEDSSRNAEAMQEFDAAFRFLELEAARSLFECQGVRGVLSEEADPTRAIDYINSARFPFELPDHLERRVVALRQWVMANLVPAPAAF